MEESEISVKNNLIIFEKNKRHGKWEIEKFPGENRDKFVEMINLLIPPVFEHLHPKVRRSDLSVIFTDKIIDKGESGSDKYGFTDGRFNFETLVQSKRTVLSIAISLDGIKKMAIHSKDRYIKAAFIIFHEVFEADYWLRSLDIKLKPEQGEYKDKDYFNFEHEQIADGRAGRHMTKVLGGEFERGDHYINLHLPRHWRSYTTRG